MKSIWAPWRYDYLASAPKKAAGCIFCGALRSAKDRDHWVVLRGERVFALLNLYPYANGHVMIAPRAHVADPAEVDAATRSEMMEAMVRVEAALRAEYRPDGFNVGLNLGRSAGAGVADHFHMHIVPRWTGDTNFMTVTAEARVLSESLSATWRKIRRRLKEGGPSRGRRAGTGARGGKRGAP